MLNLEQIKTLLSWNINTCISCLAKISVNNVLCNDCSNKLPLITTQCTQCAIPIQTKVAAIKCAKCIHNPPFFDITIAPYRYQKPITNIIGQLKFKNKLSYASTLGKLLLPFILQTYTTDSLPSILIPIPLHKTRIQNRGYNQSYLISKYLSKKLNTPIQNNLVERIKNTKAQVGLSAIRRHTNLKEAFACQQKIGYSHIAIIDDVITTGQTASQVAKILKKQGASRVDIWTPARA